MGKEDSLHKNLIYNCLCSVLQQSEEAYIFIFKDVIENPVGLFIMLYASGLIVEEQFMMRLVQQEAYWTWTQKTLVQYFSSASFASFVSSCKELNLIETPGEI